MGKLTYLSPSTIKMLYDMPHCFLNKMMGVPQPDNIYFENGKRLHRIIQDHLSGDKVRDDLKHIKYSFDIVEKVDFDPRCKIMFPIKKGFMMMGYYDGFNTKTGECLEIKTGGEMWSVGKFHESNQRRVYAIGNKGIKKNVLVTALSDENKWQEIPPKVYSFPVEKEDIDKAWSWIMGAVKIVEDGAFMTDLVDGKCVNYQCYWKENCQFR